MIQWGRLFLVRAPRSLEENLLHRELMGILCRNRLGSRPRPGSNGIDVSPGLPFSVGVLIRSEEEEMYEARV